jgi:hemerythrin-like metal-binding protein
MKERNKMSEEKLEAFTWDNKFNTDVELVDSQHHVLVDLINRLGSICAHQSNPEELGKILTELANYTVYHFDTEEKLMREYEVNTSHQNIHIKAHRHFTEQVKVAAKILMRSTDISTQLVAPLFKYLTNWLVQHILGTDMRLAKEILALQSGLNHEEATRQATAFMNQSANVLLEALNEMYGKLGDKTLEVIQKNQELEAEQVALKLLNEQLETRVLQRTSDVELVNKQLITNNVELLKLNEKLESAHTQLLQSEKMASIGQLAAGVAHEINNPVGFVNSNLGTLGKYIANLFKVIAAYEAAEAQTASKLFSEVSLTKESVDFPYLKEDIPSLLKESQEGLARVKHIVQDLMDFSHVDESGWQHANLENGIDSTLNVVSNEIKLKAEIIKEYCGLPEVDCMPSQINQVFMNLLLNAAQSIEGKGIITIRTGSVNDLIWIEIEDSGKGIAPDHLNRIFDPFFTTKPVGTGTGLGLSLTYGIIQKHHGRIEVRSQPEKGSTFRIWLPIHQAEKS